MDSKEALVGTFKAEIAYGIWMFKLRMLKETISLARMRDDQVIRQQKSICLFNRPITDIFFPTKLKATSPIKRSPRPKCIRGEHSNFSLIVSKILPRSQVLWSTTSIVRRHTDNSNDEEPQSKISLHALSRCSAYQAIRVMMKIGHCEMVVLIDNGSTQFH